MSSFLYVRLHYNVIAKMRLPYAQISLQIWILFLVGLALFIKPLGGNSQNFLGKFVRCFVTLKCFYGVVIHRK